MVSVIDYGMGNIHSVKKALEVCGAPVLVTSKPEDIISSEGIVLPGVGAFGEAMDELEKRKLIPVIKDSAKNNKALLGICLGMQVLFEESQESDGKKGLGLLEGKVKKFPKAEFKVPHMGWNQVKINPQNKCPLLDGLSDGVYFYFCHSYYPEPLNNHEVAATTNYGIDFASMVYSKNIFGTQFHPEKSQLAGLKIIDNFLKLCL